MASFLHIVWNTCQRKAELSKTCSIEKAIGESIGIEKISHAYLLALHEELEHMILHEKLDNVFYELAFERLIARGQYFYPVDTSAYFSMELDTPEDFHDAINRIPKHLQAWKLYFFANKNTR